MNNYNNNRSNGGSRSYDNLISVTTKANIQLEVTEWRGEILTVEMEDYLQSRLDSATSNNGNRRMNVEAFTMHTSQKFSPLMVLLPMSSIHSKQNNCLDQLPTVYQNIIKSNSKSKGITLDGAVAKALAPYMFKGSELHEFDKPEERERLGLSRQVAKQMKIYSKPRVAKFKNKEAVMIALDPAKIIKDMVLVPGDNRRYLIAIDKVSRSSTGKCSYKFVRYISCKGSIRNPEFGNIYDELSRMVMVGSSLHHDHNKKKKHR